jgi:hypothetical protein
LKAIPGVGFRLVSPAVVVVVDVGVDDVGTADDGVVEHELKYKKLSLGRLLLILLHRNIFLLNNICFDFNFTLEVLNY